MKIEVSKTNSKLFQVKKELEDKYNNLSGKIVSEVAPVVSTEVMSVILPRIQPLEANSASQVDLKPMQPPMNHGEPDY